MKPAVVIEDLSIDIDHHKILKNISVDLAPGKIIGLLGPSGAGKTTLMQAIVGLQKISRGELNILGFPAGHPILRKQIGYMPQASSIYLDLSVRQNLRYFATMGGYSKREAAEVIDEVDLIKQSDRLARNLSGGQKSRVSLAAALIGKPMLLVLDEPTVGLDPILRLRLWEIFKRLAANGTTLIISSHVMEEANYCQELMLMRNGKLLAFGTPHDLRNQTGTRSIEDSFIKLVEANR